MAPRRKQEPVCARTEPGARLDDLILETRGLTKEFRGFTAVQGVDLKVRRGTIHALIGPNGAGKTTVFNLLTKFLEPSAGRIIYNGRDITADAAGRGRAARAGALVPDLGGVPASERARQCPRRVAAAARQLVPFLALGARRSTGSTTRADELLDAVGLAGFRGQRGGGAALWPQARARNRDDPGARPRDAAARRADVGAGPGGYRPHLGADPRGGARPHRADGRAQPVGRRRSVADRSPC